MSRPSWLVLLLSQFIFSAALAGPTSFDGLKKRAEARFAAKSFSKAHKLYKQAEALALTPRQARWVKFRLADSYWRAEARSSRPDSSKLHQARQTIEAMLQAVQRVDNRDRVWAECQESLGDYHWRKSSRSWYQAWRYYQQALEWWAGAADMKMAKQRYLRMVFAIADPPWKEAYYYYGYHGNWLPVEVVENVLKVARTKEQKAQALYFLAMTLKNRGGDYRQRARIPRAFEDAIRVGRGTDWYDDALYHYAQHMENTGHLIEQESGGYRSERDYPKALELYRRIVSEFKKGETRYYDDAKSRIKYITQESLSVSVSNIFLPGSGVQYHLNWRNLKKLELSLYQVDLTRAVKYDKRRSGSSWLHTIDLPRQKRLRSWSYATGDKGKHLPGSAKQVLKGKLSPGAYVLHARSGKVKSRELILISDATLVVKTAGNKVVAFFCDAESGQPVVDAKVSAWYRRYYKSNYQWQQKTAHTGTDGLAAFTFDQTTSSADVFVAARQGVRQAFSPAYASRSGRSDTWRVYAFTDRPAYRPEDEVQFKFIVRGYDGKTYSTPVDQELVYRIDDARGSKVVEDKGKLNAFGSMWGSLKLTESMPLGEYRVTFWTANKRRHVGSATLFRLEEYKLPEFAVKVETPEENGRAKIFRVGDKVQTDIQVDYYFGGAVVNADVDVRVYQRPYYQYWQPVRQFPWFYSDMDTRSHRWYGGHGSQIKHQRLKTDARGRAQISFDTPSGSNQDYQYKIEARVTDSSRREVIGSGTVRVTRQDFFVHAKPSHYLHRPRSLVEVEFSALDANSEPVTAKGQVTVTRNHWYEIWVGPKGQRLTGEALSKRRMQPEPFPPPGGKWHLLKTGYESEQVLKKSASTNSKGKSIFTFKPAREGYYSVAWESPQKGRTPIRASATLWVASHTSRDVGYHHGGLQIIADRDTFKAGQKVPVMLVSPVSNRWVLFSVESDQLHHWQLVHLEGTVKLITLEVTEEHVPNVFLSAHMVADRALFNDVRQVVVPPERNYLDVQLSADKEVYRPQDKARLKVRTLDHKGKPVRAEVGLSLVDESIYYIQSEYAADPRQYFYGQKRGRSVQTRSTFQHRAYIRLVESPRGGLVDERYLAAEIEAARREKQKAANELERSRDIDDLGGAEMEESIALDMAPSSAAGPVRRSRSAPKKMMKEVSKSELAAPAEPAPVVVADAPSDQGAPEEAVQVRSDFRATALWKPDLVTDARGQASIETKMPDNLTSWKAVARAVSAVNKFGLGGASARTRMPLIARLQAPRFFVVGDELVISTVVNNNTPKALRARVDLFAQGVRILGGQKDGSGWRGVRRQARIGADGEARLDWRVKVERAGPVVLKTVARGAGLADAMEKKYRAYDHGIEKMIARGGKLRGREARIKMKLPPFRAGSASLSVQLAPSLATTMLDALPYLIDYPYGCTEQTMSRFLPLVISAKTLKDLGVEPGQVMHKAFGGIEAQHADKTHSKGKRSLEKMDVMTKSGLARLYDFQHSDGGWGWWKTGESDRYMTAYVIWGLVLSAQAGVTVRSGVIDRGYRFLNDNLVKEERSLDRQAWLLHALSAVHKYKRTSKVHKYQTRAFENLWDRREHLNAYSRALLTVAAVNYGYRDKARVLADNLADGAISDQRPDKSVIMRGEPKDSAAETMATVRWGKDRGWWRWSEGAVETTAFVLRALVAVDPNHELVEPAMNWLIKNRRGAQWSNTRDTAIVVLALNDYLRHSKELGQAVAYSLLVNGRKVAQKKLSGAELIGGTSTFQIDPAHIRKGTNEIVIRKKSGKALYFFARADFFSLEEPIAAAGNEIFVRRQYYKWVARPSLFKGEVFERKPLNDGDTVVSGQRVEVVVTVDSKNDYEYLVFEDLKPAGLEAVQVKSGQPVYIRELKVDAVAQGYAGKQKKDWRNRLSSAAFEGLDYTNRSRRIHQEFRDRKVALFVDKLPQGVWEVRYDLRAEVPGNFHALPLLGHAMYVPEIRANGAEVRLEVFDRP